MGEWDSSKTGPSGQSFKKDIYITTKKYNKFPDFFVQAFKMDVDSRKFSMLLLYIL